MAMAITRVRIRDMAMVHTVMDTALDRHTNTHPAAIIRMAMGTTTTDTETPAITDNHTVLHTVRLESAFTHPADTGGKELRTAVNSQTATGRCVASRRLSSTTKAH